MDFPRPGQWCRFLLFLPALLVLAACASFEIPTPQVDFKRGYNFSAVKTFAMQPRRGAHGGSSLLGGQASTRAEQAMQLGLKERGLEMVTDPAAADVLLSWYLVTEERSDIRSYDSTSFYNCWRCGPVGADVSVQEYTQGTLIVDLIDPGLSQSVWRGIMKSRLTGVMEKEAGQQRRFNAVARTLFASFPPG